MNDRQTERREQWLARIAEQEKSGQSVRVFCRDRSLGEYSFYTWRRRLRKERPVSFALVETARSAGAMIEFVLTSGDRLRIAAEADTLRTVMGVLRERV
jgi:hypothetical protein